MSDDVTLLHEEALAQHRAEIRRLQARVDQLASLLAAESARVAKLQQQVRRRDAAIASAENTCSRAGSCFPKMQGA